MKTSTIALMALGVFVQSTLATVAFGVNHGNGNINVAWIDGENPCGTDVQVSQTGQNPCGIDFTLSNGFTYFFENCGDSAFALYNGDGTYNHQCSGGHENFNCKDPNNGASYSITLNWIC
jgi:hypothetical protein